MAPNGFMDGSPEPTCLAGEGKDNNTRKNSKEEDQTSRRQPLKYANIISITLIHFVSVYYAITGIHEPLIPTIMFSFVYGWASGLGVTAGAHRLWTHKAYKAKWPLRVFLACCFSCAGQNTLPQWVLDHRVHHKFSETDADPHNSNRGFFFAHVGWLMQLKHPQVLIKGKQIDMSDVLSDPVIHYHTKYFIPLKIFFCYLLPTMIPYCCWNETLKVSAMANIIRYVCSLNFTWSVNSAAHIFGYRPFSAQIRPAENIAVSIVALGEGWHNYHHVFPWDYKAAEFGHIIYNPTAVFIDFCAKLGLAYDRKSPSRSLVEKVAKRYGDGTYILDHHAVGEIDENGRGIKREDDNQANIEEFDRSETY